MYSREFHASIQHEERPQAERLGLYIKTYVPCQTFIDFGCSSGLYLLEVKKQLPDIKALGYEFSEAAVNAALCMDVHHFDLTQVLDRPKSPMTLGLCLEVLEHIEDSHWRPVLENITKLSDIIIFSAARPGQGGTGHINCRPKIDWIRRFSSLGWIVDHDFTSHLLAYMKNGPHMGWFANNAIVLVK